MAKKQTPVQEPKAPKTIKVKTLVVSVAVLLGMIASFIAGTVVANNYNSTVKARALELAKEFDSKSRD